MTLVVRDTRLIATPYTAHKATKMPRSHQPGTGGCHCNLLELRLPDQSSGPGMPTT